MPETFFDAILHAGVGWVDDGHNEVNQEGLLSVVDNLVFLLDVDEIRAGDGRIKEHLFIVGGVHHREFVIKAIDKPDKTFTRPRDPVVVVDEDVMAHSQLDDDDLLIIPGTHASVLEVEPNHLVLALP